MYICPKCGNKISSDELMMVTPKCPKCGNKMKYADTIEEYTNMQEEAAAMEKEVAAMEKEAVAMEKGSKSMYNNRQYVANKLNGFAKVFWYLGLISSVIIFLLTMIPVISLDPYYMETSVKVTTILTTAIVLIIAIIIIYFWKLMLMGFASIIENTAKTNQVLEKIQEKLK